MHGFSFLRDAFWYDYDWRQNIITRDKKPILCYYSKGERKNVLIFPLNPANDITLKRNSNYEGRLKTGIPEIHKYYVVYS